MYYIPGQHALVLVSSTFYAVQAWKRLMGFDKTKDTFFMYWIFNETSCQEKYYPYWTKEVSEKVFPYGPFMQFCSDTGLMYRVRLRTLLKFIKHVFYLIRFKFDFQVIRKVSISLPLYDSVQHEQLRQSRFINGKIVTADMISLKNSKEIYIQSRQGVSLESVDRATVVNFPGV